ncbi:MAG TPA: hypothetical protein DCM86_18510, partial [Verrucomicrobiales bacterium]|nr:hypothetical protein [Verrucomicrobiales bacterium]
MNPVLFHRPEVRLSPVRAGFPMQWRSALAALCIAAMHAGAAPHVTRVVPGSAARPGFTRVPGALSGIRFVNTLTAEQAARNQIRLNGSGVAAGDIDGDGLCDLYFCSLAGSNVLYRNIGNWRFEDITMRSGTACPGQESTGALFADVDGNGTLDLLVNSIGRGTRCFLNDGRGRFTENASAGLLRAFGAMSLAMADVDGDGDLDLYVVNYRASTIRSTGFSVLNVNGRRSILPGDRGHLEYTPDGRLLELGEPDTLYLNDGHGNFTQVLWTGGSFLDEQGRPLTEPPRDWGLTAMFRDLNGDGAPDLYVCNDFQSPDRLWINDGHGKFRLAPAQALRHTPTYSMCVDVADVDRDGIDDLLVVDMLEPRHRDRFRQTVGFEPVLLTPGDLLERPQYDHNTLQLGRGDCTYADVSHLWGIEASGWTWCVAFLDVDLDGYEDLLMTRGHMFNTQDCDANARIDREGPYTREQIPYKVWKYPPLRLPNTAFRNLRGAGFEEVGAEWGFGVEEGVTQGMSLVDLDNDGDLDVVVSGLNGEAGVYRNEGSGGRVGVRLHGMGGNVGGVGGRIRLEGGAVKVQEQEVMSGGRYLSGDEGMRVFASGRQAGGMRIEVKWRSGRRSVVEGVEANRIYEVWESEAVKGEGRVGGGVAGPGMLFEDVSMGFGHTHHEEEYDDFGRQPLLPSRLSQLGPGVGWVDIDRDGRDDLVVGTGKGGSIGMYRNEGKGKWSVMRVGVVEKRDQTGMAWDGRELWVGSSSYEDAQQGPGKWVKGYAGGVEQEGEGMEGGETSCGPVAMGDVDGDGELELFVGARVKPKSLMPGREDMGSLSAETRKGQNAERRGRGQQIFNAEARRGGGTESGKGGERGRERER